MLFKKETKTIDITEPKIIFVESLVDSNVTFNIFSKCEIIFVSNNENSNSKLSFNLVKENSSLLIRQLILSKDKTKIINDVEVIHKAKRTNCDYKLFAFGFNESEIKVMAKNRILSGMNQSETHQMLKVLTEDKARAFAQPGLMVDEFDVVASHGNSIGQLDPKIMFYLETKGIERKKARWMIIEGIIEDLFKETTNNNKKEILSSLRESLEVNHG